jgi:hypothetical protein
MAEIRHILRIACRPAAAYTGKRRRALVYQLVYRKVAFGI